MNSENPRKDPDDFYERNARTDELIKIWTFASHNMRKGLEHRPSYEGFPLAYACDLAEHPLGHLLPPEDRKEEIPEETFRNPSPEKLVSFLEALKPNFLPQQILDIFGHDRELDKISRRILKRWEAYGDNALYECFPIQTEVKKIEERMLPLLTALKHWIQTHKKKIQAKVKHLVRTKPPHDPDQVAKSFRRDTPSLDTIFTKSQLRQLKPVLQELYAARQKHTLGLGHEDLGVALTACTKKLEQFNDLLKEKGITPDTLSGDMLNYDCLNENYRE